MFLLPSSLYTIHQGQANGVGPSPRVWSNVIGQESSPDGFTNGRYVGDNFLNFGQVAAAADNHQGYGAYVDTGNTIKQLADDNGGVQFATDATDNDESWLTTGGNFGALGRISDATGEDKLTIFEASVTLGQIGDNGGAPFVGLAAPGSAVADSKVDDTGALGMGHYIGFDGVHADGDAINFVYKAAGETAQTLISGIHVPVAGTKVKLGFVYDPRFKDSEKIKVYVDNVENATKVTSTLIAADEFPDAEWLAFLIGIKNGGAVASTLECNWWHFFQAG